MTRLSVSLENSGAVRSLLRFFGGLSMTRFLLQNDTFCTKKGVIASEAKQSVSSIFAEISNLQIASLTTAKELARCALAF
jgi:hypothetical protein